MLKPRERYRRQWPGPGASEWGLQAPCCCPHEEDSKRTHKTHEPKVEESSRQRNKKPGSLVADPDSKDGLWPEQSPTDWEQGTGGDNGGSWSSAEPGIRGDVKAGRGSCSPQEPRGGCASDSVCQLRTSHLIHLSLKQTQMLLQWSLGVSHLIRLSPKETLPTAQWGRLVGHHNLPLLPGHTAG